MTLHLPLYSEYTHWRDYLGVNRCIVERVRLGVCKVINVYGSWACWGRTPNARESQTSKETSKMKLV